jgi:para-nitrobenzyl esterase
MEELKKLFERISLEDTFVNITNAPWRLAVLASLLLITVTWATWGQVTYKPIASDPIRVDGGLISGTHLKSGLKAYFGVPFVAPPIRENRWREPQPVQPWEGVLTANRMMPECVQNLRSNNINHYFGDEAACEDCLYLNLWAPSNAKAGDKLPVIVWIYGGAFSGGSASMALYGGQGLAKKGVVYVAFNYRVGIFGFLAHPDATRESGHNASGNWGFLDQVAALKWIQRNIAKFGGDPNNVMLIGQSAGSMSINYLQASPLAKGLFHKAFGMSGGTIKGPGSETGKLADAEAQGIKLQEALKVKSLAEMRTFSSDKVTTAAQAAGVRASPIVDGYYLPQHTGEIFAAGHQNDLPIVVGSTANDMGTNLEVRRATTVAEYRAAAEKMYGPNAAAFLAVFPAATDADVKAAAEQAATGSGMGLGARTWAKAQTDTGKAPAYLFLFSRTHPYAPGMVFADHDPKTVGAYHTGDVPYWLDTQDAFNMFRVTRNWEGYDRDLAAKMSDVVIAFAKIGNPSTNAVKMVRYNAADEQLVDFGDSIKVVKLNTKGLDFIANTPAIPTGRGGRGAPPDGVVTKK